MDLGAGAGCQRRQTFYAQAPIRHAPNLAARALTKVHLNRILHSTEHPWATMQNPNRLKLSEALLKLDALLGSGFKKLSVFLVSLPNKSR